MPAALIAPADVDEAIKEVDRAVKLGFRAVNIPVRPYHESAGAKSSQIGYNSPMFEPLWSAIEDTGVPLTCHIATGKDPRTASGEGGAVINYVTHAMTPAIEPFTHFCASGILERHPKLRFGTIESGFGFVPWMLSGMDEAYEKHHFWVFPKLKMLPSEYFRRQCFASFQEDPAGVRLARDYQITKNGLWGSDYPHHEARGRTRTRRSPAPWATSPRKSVATCSASTPRASSGSLCRSSTATTSTATNARRYRMQ